MGVVTMKARFGESEVTIETGKIATLVSGAVTITMGETVVLVTCAGASSMRPGTNFLPLTCEYIEKKYAAGKIPGGYFKRETRPGPAEILNARLMDRPMRPLFPKTWRKDIQLIATVMSFDGENDPAIAAMLGASAATCVSEIPFDGPMAGCRVALIDGEYLINPPNSQLEGAKLNLIVAATKDAVTMVEGEGDEASEEEMLDAILAAHDAIKPMIDLQVKFTKKAGTPKLSVSPEAIDADLFARVIDLCIADLDRTLPNQSKSERKESLSAIKADVLAQLTEEDESLASRKDEIKEYIEDIYREVVRTRVVETRERMDGRRLDEVRRIWCETAVLPRAHGSAIFTRGETQALATVTLGSKRDEQRIDNLAGDYFDPFMLHYNFPPFCTGEAKPLRGTSRREIGHGNLATRGVRAILPQHEDFPYTIRLVSEVLESNGSSSMATVCASSMALMQAGVPTQKQVAGIAMGLIEENGKIAVLSDILGDEDHLGDMDFKVVGTRDGITAIQMDIKIKGLKRSILEQALEQARRGRLYILKEMDKCIRRPNKELTEYAPRIITINVHPDRVRDIIGPGGRTIRALSDTTGCTIDIADDGTVTVSGVGAESIAQAKLLIEQLTEEPEVGRIYEGIIKSIVGFGLFVEVLPGQEGLVHVRDLGTPRDSDLNDFFEIGQEIVVRLVEVTREGKLNLSVQGIEGNEDLLGELPEPPKVGETYEGTIRSVMPYGVFVEIMPNVDGLAHASRIRGVGRDEVQNRFSVGDALTVTIEEINKDGKISLSANLDEELEEEYEEEIEEEYEEEYEEEAPRKRSRKERTRREEPVRSSRRKPLPREQESIDLEIEEAEDLDDIQVGKVYLARVTNIKSYGAFAELAPGVHGMIHISELADHRVAQIEDVIDVGEEVYVKCIGINHDGKIRLSRREAIAEA